jgi:hypothetical protein
MGEHRHRRLALRLSADLVGRTHIGLAGLKLSMILDNLITAANDCFVTNR